MFEFAAGREYKKWECITEQPNDCSIMKGGSETGRAELRNETKIIKAKLQINTLQHMTH